MDELEKHKLPLITVTERYQFLKQLAGLPALQQYVTQENENRFGENIKIGLGEIELTATLVRLELDLEF